MNTDLNSFKILKNLSFYDGHYPSYFYFNSLINYRSETNILYNRKASEVEHKGYQALTNGFLDKPVANSEDSTAIQSLKTVLDFLQQAIAYEKKNELAYFKQKYALLKAKFNSKEFLQFKEIQSLETLFTSPDSFNYNDFLILVNSLIQGFDNTKTIVNYEKERIKEITNGVNEVTRVYGNRLIGLAKKMGMYNYDSNSLTTKGQEFYDKNMTKTQRNIQLTYLDQGSLNGTKVVKRKQKDGTYKNVTTELFSGVKKYLEPIRGTVEVEIAHWITNQAKTLTQDKKVLEELRIFIQNWYIQNFDNDGAKLSDIEANIKGIIIKTLMDYGSKHIPQILSKAYDQISIDDITNILSSSLNDVFSYDIDGLYDNIGQMGLTLDLFKNANNIQDLDENSAQQLYEAHRRMREWINKNKSKLTPEQKYTIKALHIGTKENDEYKEFMQLIKDLERLLANYEQALKKNQNIIQSVSRSINPTKKRTVDNTKYTLNISIKNGKVDLTDLKKIIKKVDKNNKFIRYLSDLDATSLEGLITGLKARVSNQMKKDIITVVEKLSKGDQSKQQGIIAKLRDGLQNMYISIGGPTLQEFRLGILENMDQAIRTHGRTGPVNRKNDFVTITFQYDEQIIGQMIAEQVTNKNTIETLAKTISNAQNDLKDSYAKEFSNYFYTELQRLNTGRQFEHNSYKKNAEIFFDFISRQNENFTLLNDEFNKTAMAWQEYREEQLLAGKNVEELNNERSEILNSLKESFFVSSTMKTYNQYQNNIGFIGGSIGANLLEQLNNLNDLFTEAGAPIKSDDMDWLIGAIINCSPVSIIGERNKNIIENYLGAVAAFTIFDEGLAEMQIINALKNPNNEIINSSPNILHLYSVNGLYVPGSYVLQEVYEHLNECLNLMNLGLENINHRGAGIIIRNTMTERNIPNRNGELTDLNPWQTIGERAIKSVSLKVVFLGGLMEILNKMNNAMKEIQIPG